MKPTQTQELFVSIKKTFVSFFSILMFVALGVSVFLGISWAGPALENATGQVFDKGSFHNFQVQFPYGLTDSDVKALSEIEGVSQVETAYQSFQTVRLDGNKLTVKVQSLGQSIDTPIVAEGELPTKAGEMAFHAKSASQLNIHVGDTITFEKDADGSSDDMAALLNEGELSASSESNSPESSADSTASTGSKSDMKYLTDSTFVVTAIIDSPEYLAFDPISYGYAPTPSGSVDAIAWVTDDAFMESAFLNAHPIANVRSDGLAGLSSFSDEYKAASGEIEARITELGDTLGTARYDDLHGKAQKRIDEAQAKIDGGKREITEGEAKIADAREQLETERAAGEAKLASAYEELQGYEYQKAQGQAGVLAVPDGEVAAVHPDLLTAKAQEERRGLGAVTQHKPVPGVEFNNSLCGKRKVEHGSLQKIEMIGKREGHTRAGHRRPSPAVFTVRYTSPPPCPDPRPASAARARWRSSSAGRARPAAAARFAAAARR